jgi:uncharacterized protein (DUF1697 family)
MALVVLLKGVNVGGHRTFRPARLAERLSHLGAVSIGAAGTFVIPERVTRTALRAEFARRLPFDAQITICEGREITRIAAHDVFARHSAGPGITPFVSVLSASPRVAPATPLRFPPDGDWLVTVLAREGRFVIGLYRRHMKTIGYLGALDRVFGRPATTRNWNTLMSILAVLERDGKAQG